ncbi:HPP family protein [Vibrio fluvialis]|uniref:HPP family protein n=1 Tax=Vibrio fluvialis TaxID=676 RepID=UPI0012AE32E8|nr:HPP family protein [Vibrio fluvialis]EKO3391455.1 HPP family protein [Vibrio fluvialis]EKO3539349.1 HPP family protein [Vibrio fluvialis]EKO3988637.1 HPP family protein [Vibrio fluvialis]
MNHLKSALLAGFAATCAIGLLSYADAWSSAGLWLMAPFGATAVLVFGVPDSPLAQPKNVIFGHLITASVGLVFVHWLPVEPWSLAIATGLAISLMLVTKTTHPPAGANPLLIMLTGQSWSFLVTPVLIGALVIVLCGQLNQLWSRKWLSARQSRA